MRTTLTTGQLMPTTTTRITATLLFPSSHLPSKEYVTLEEVFDAYYACRKRKRRKLSLLQFELNYELACYKLYSELNSMTYELTESTVFCVTKPKIREVFAANFRDRIIHHLIHNKLNLFFEAEMLDCTFACRLGKGTLYGVRYILKCMDELGPEAWYAKCDILGFFMSINRDILYNEVERIVRKYVVNDCEWWLWLLKLVIYNRPEQHCYIKGDIKLWDKLPKNKSLFYSNGVGLPIGNLTSQILANVFMSMFDKWVVNLLGCNGKYGRYVDDFIIMHNNKHILLSCIHTLRIFLNDSMILKIHPRKLVIQLIHKGIKFVGKFIKGVCVHPGKSTIYNIMKVIRKQLITDILSFVCSMNSYFGLILHSNSYHLRRQMWTKILNKDGLFITNYRKIKIIKNEKIHKSHNTL